MIARLYVKCPDVEFEMAEARILKTMKTTRPFASKFNPVTSLNSYPKLSKIMNEIKVFLSSI